MNKNFKLTLQVILSAILIMEGTRAATWLMNQSNTAVFYLGIILLIGCVVGFFFITLDSVIKLFLNLKNKNKNESIR
jgi:multidrug efflux pump subunit AcrB